MHAAGRRGGHQNQGTTSDCRAAQLAGSNGDVASSRRHGDTRDAVTLNGCGEGQTVTLVGAGLLESAVGGESFGDGGLGASGQIHAFADPGTNGVILIRRNRDGSQNADDRHMSSIRVKPCWNFFMECS